MCFTLLWFRDLLIWLVILVAVVALLRLLVPWLMAKLQVGESGVIMRAIDIFVWAVVIIFVIYVIFALIACLAGGGAGTLPLFPRAK